MSDDAVVDALAVLQQRRDEALMEVQRIEAAITSLVGLVRPAAVRGDVLDFKDGRPSVKAMMQKLLDEAARDWSVKEILDAYRERGTPIQAKSPSNALRAALTEASKANQVVRTNIGRYQSARWAPLIMDLKMTREGITGPDGSPPLEALK